MCCYSQKLKADDTASFGLRSVKLDVDSHSYFPLHQDSILYDFVSPFRRTPSSWFSEDTYFKFNSLVIMSFQDVMCWFLCLCLLYDNFVVVQCRQPPMYVNQFAIYVPKGQEAADRVAAKYGFKNLGQVGPLIQNLMEAIFRRLLIRNRCSTLAVS
ncbi:hypothetical protein J437_LFUL011562 [Ladona fulva]|uniref:Peptidase S8 pro-domain domain-containing protein n=1 Tax=Ladona fulva TaxID=123851 RepID=A0A8K0P0H3_LADFU|nr:hypothetical protein J437_LFUL011562 [Ladona fulva]